LQGYWKRLDGGAAIGCNVRGYTVTSFQKLQRSRKTAQTKKLHKPQKNFNMILSDQDGSGGNLSWC